MEHACGHVHWQLMSERVHKMITFVIAEIQKHFEAWKIGLVNLVFGVLALPPTGEDVGYLELYMEYLADK